jgi:hypothetical protein
MYTLTLSLLMAKGPTHMTSTDHAWFTLFAIFSHYKLNKIISFEFVCILKFSSLLFIIHIATFHFSSYHSEWSAIMTDKNAREVAIALSQNLVSFHKGVALRRGRQKSYLPMIKWFCPDWKMDKSILYIKRGKGLVKST